MKSLLEYLLESSQRGAEQVMLDRHARARKQLKKAQELIEEAAEDLAEARLAAIILNAHRRNALKEPLDLPRVPGPNPPTTNCRLQRVRRDPGQNGKLRPAKIMIEPELDQPLQD